MRNQLLYDPKKAKRNCYGAALLLIISLGASIALLLIAFYIIPRGGGGTDDRTIDTPWNGDKWTPVGGDIVPNNSAVSGNCGGDVDISGDGTLVIVGCPFANNFHGSAHLYQYHHNVDVEVDVEVEVKGRGVYADINAGIRNNSNKNSTNATSNTWNEIGRWNGENSGDLLGSAVSIASENPDIVAISEPQFGKNKKGGKYGRVIVYENKSGLKDGNGNGLSHLFQSIGGAIEGNHNLEHFGYNIDLSGSGDRIVVGAYTSKYIEVVDFNPRTKQWELPPDAYVDTDSTIVSAGSVTSVAVSSDGTKVGYGSSLGANFFGKDVDSSNHRSYSLYSDESSYSVSISGDGKVIAVGDWGYDCGTKMLDCGRVRVFDISTSDAAQIGNDITGTNENGFCGISLDISGDGQTIVIGCSHKKAMIAMLKDDNDDGKSQKNRLWDIYPLSFEDDLSSVAISSDASTVAFGSERGIVRVLKREAATTIPSSPENKTPQSKPISTACNEDENTKFALVNERNKIQTCGKLAANPENIPQICSSNLKLHTPAALCPNTCGISDTATESPSSMWVGLIKKRGQLVLKPRSCGWLSDQDHTVKESVCNRDTSELIPSNACCETCGRIR